jgi:cold shock CspA family protein
MARFQGVADVRSTITMETQTGVVKQFDFARRYGFIRPDDGSNSLFFHERETEHRGISQGTRVNYFRVTDRSGRPCAVHVREGVN